MELTFFPFEDRDVYVLILYIVEHEEQHCSGVHRVVEESVAGDIQ